MKIKVLFSMLCLVLGSLSTYGQTHYAPPRKEIRHKIKHLPQENYFQQATTRASGEYIMQEFPTEGEVKGVVIPVSFADVHFSTKNIKEVLSQRYNGYHINENSDTVYTPYPLTIEHREYSYVDTATIALRATIPGCARDYFHEMSMGKFTPVFHVTDTIKLDENRVSYGGNNNSEERSKKMFTEACQKAYNSGLVNFDDYCNGDNTVDFVYVVFAGSDEAQTGIEECVWAHANINLNVNLGGKEIAISRYACSGELFIDLKGLPAGIGTFVHEFSHVLGLPDFYNTIDDTNPKLSMDVWSVMDYGMYNRGGFVPCAYTAFERYSLDWLPMATLNEPATLSIGTTEEEKTGYRIFVSEDTDTTAFYLVETIRKEGWNKYAYAEGLLISMVDYKAEAWTSNQVNVENTYRHYVVPANNHWSIAGEEYNPSLHLFGNTINKFTNEEGAKPTSKTKKPLTNIVFKDGKTTFDFCGGSNTNGVEEMRNQESRIGNIYDLQGRPVEKPSRGIYIQNGKKIVIK